MTLAKAQLCLSWKQNRDFRERKIKENAFFSRQFFFYRNAKKDGENQNVEKTRKKRLKSRKRVRKNKKTKSEGSIQSATCGEWLRARQVALVVARLPKERSLTSCSRNSRWGELLLANESTLPPYFAWERPGRTPNGPEAQFTVFFFFFPKCHE